MADKDRSIDAVIRKAMEDGKFDNLPGMGKPLKLDKNPYADPEWALAFDMLSKNGYALPWMEKRNEIESDLARAKETLARMWAWRQKRINDDSGEFEPFFVENEWKTAVRKFEETVAAINKRIESYNLEVPGDVFMRLRVNAEREISEIQADKS